MPESAKVKTAVNRLRENNFEYTYKHCTYEKAGHMLTLPYQSISDLKKWRVSLEEWEKACVESWKQTTDFLEKWSYDA